MEVWIQIIVPIITGLAACVPLAITLVEWIKKAAKEKNWTALMQLVLKLMTEAEANYSTGAEKKEYVIDSINAIKGTLNYDVDMNVVSDMIDSVIIATKKINTK
jgi:hypothetical protein